MAPFNEILSFKLRCPYDDWPFKLSKVTPALNTVIGRLKTSHRQHLVALKNAPHFSQFTLSSLLLLLASLTFSGP